MTSAFVKGFAKGLLDYRLADQQEERELSSYEKKQRLLKSMETTDEKDFDKGKIVTRDGNGQVIRERPMTNDEIIAHKLDRDKDKAAVEGVIARTDVDKKQASTFEEDRRIKLDEAAQNRELRKASLANTQMNTASMIADRNDKALDRRDAREGAVQEYGAAALNDLNEALRYMPIPAEGPAKDRDIANRNKILNNTAARVKRIQETPGKTTAQKKAAIDAVIRPVLSLLPKTNALKSLDSSAGTESSITPLPK